MRKLPLFERVVRRSSVYRGRAGRMITQQGLKVPCAFMHLPKCGGTSLSEALYALVPLNRKIGILDAPSSRRALGVYNQGTDDPRPYHDEGDNADAMMAFREQLLLMHMAHEADLIHGHFLFSEKGYAAFGDRYKFITIMREPVARTVSNFKMASANKVFAGDLDAFIESSMGRRMAQHALRYLTGRATIAAEEVAGLLPLATSNLERFAVVGLIEQQDRFVSHFADVFGSRPRIGHHNRGGEGKTEVTAAQRTRLEQLCAPDIELYEMARQRQ